MPTEEQKAEIRWAVGAIGAHQRDYRRYLDYYDGKHPLMVSQARLKRLFGDMFKDFRLNLCGTVVDALTDRLHVASFSGDGAAAQEALAIWKRNRMRSRQGHVHQKAVAAGDAYVLVWPDAAGEPVIHPQEPTEVAVEYEEESLGRIKRAAKLWKDPGGSHCLTLYYPDRIEKYETPIKTHGLALGAANWRERTVDGEPWPLPNPYDAVPVFHFGNRADVGRHGVSELRDALPVQDGLNKAVMDMLISGEFQAYPQRYALNIEVKKDVEGNPINPFKAGPEKMWVLTGGENVQLGQFAAADTTKLMEVKQGWALDMAQVSHTPAHYFFLPSGLVSGESQKTAEQKLDSKVSDRTAEFGDVWAAVMALAVRMGRGEASGPLELDCNWANKKPRIETEEWYVAQMKADLGVSRAQILREQGYSDEQIEQFARERAEEGSGTENPFGAIPGGTR
jgi:hypothetical protein